MITIYSRDDCPWCDRAKEMLSMNGESYEEIKIGRDITREELLEQFPNAKTVPHIIIDENVIGGFEQLCSYYTSETKHSHSLEV